MTEATEPGPAMGAPPRILVVDDTPENLDIVRVRLEAHGYAVATEPDGERGLARARAAPPDLILLDVMMPRMNGIEVLRHLKADPVLRFVPVILLTAKAATEDLVGGLDAGADDYLTKPFEHAALMARVRAALRLKELTDTVRAQAEAIAVQREALARVNADLEAEVAAKVAENERIGRLRGFLPPEVAAIVAGERADPALLQAHRREITVLFCDLRGFTAFTDTAAPEETFAVLGQYHAAVGEAVSRFGGTLEHFAGDGIMVFFNDPVPCPDHVARAVRMAFALREGIGTLARAWEAQGFEIGFGIGIACGYATLGQVGFEGRREYAAIGTVTNLASRLCDEARPGQIVVAQRVWSAVEPWVLGQSLGGLALKGFVRPIPAHNLTGIKPGSPVPRAPNSG